jgi:hypothetical protein
MRSSTPRDSIDTSGGGGAGGPDEYEPMLVLKSKGKVIMSVLLVSVVFRVLG